MTDKKTKAVTLLRRYDELRAELRTVERELSRACTDYGVSRGIWGFNRDHLRMQVELEKGDAA
jgi:hypothetical protein